MNATSAALTLNTGHPMPPIGFGTWQVARTAVASAAAAGYRAFDTATMYGNEKDVARGIAEARLDASEVFLTTKVWSNDMGYERTLKAFERSRRQLAVDVVDLYLIHWPQPNDTLMVETWRAMEHLFARGSVRSIGVSNFEEADLDLLARNSEVTPAVNQIRLDPTRPRTRLVGENTARGIVTTAHSPLGQGGELLRDRVLGRVAEQHGVTTAQVVLRWMLHKRIVAIPRSSKPTHIATNIDLDDFALNETQIALIDGLGE